jgi:hypothetical protein
MGYCATTQFCPYLNLNGVGNSLLVSKAVNSRVLATNAVTTAKVLNYKITTAKLATSAVTNSKILNANIGLGSGNSGSTAGKLNAKYKTFAFTATGTLLQVTHGLGRTPVGYLVFAPSKAGVVYRATTAYLKATQIWVKCNATVAGTFLIW